MIEIPNVSALNPASSQARQSSQAPARQEPASPTGAADMFSSSLSSADDIQQFLNKQIVGKLNEILEASGAETIENLAPEDYTPEAVSDRILAFVSAGLAEFEGDDARYQQRLEAAREGVEKGFNEAVEILSGLGVYEGDIAANAEKTFELLQQGLDRLANRGEGDTQPVA